MSATLAVVTGKLEPVKSAPIAPPVMVTAQWIAPQFDAFNDAAAEAEAKKCTVMLAVAGRGIDTFDALGETGLAQFDDALAAFVQATRLVDGEGKSVNGPTTRAAGNFASAARAVFGAVIRGKLERGEVERFTNNESLVAAARKALEGVNWRTGGATLTPVEREAADIARKQDRAAEQIEKLAAKLGYTPARAKALQEKARKVAGKQAVADHREKLAESAAEYAASLVERMGKIKAVAYLTKALAVAKAAQ
jgi:hypothetical protein